MVPKCAYFIYLWPKLPDLVKDVSPVVFSRLPSLNKPTRRLEVPVLRVGSRLTRSISQVSNLSRPTRSQLKRSLSIVSTWSSRNSRQSSASRSSSQQRQAARNTLAAPVRRVGCGEWRCDQQRRVAPSRVIFDV